MADPKKILRSEDHRTDVKNRLLEADAYARLERSRAGQRESFDRLVLQFDVRRQALRDLDEIRFRTDQWEYRFSRLEADLNQRPTYSFLNLPIIREYMTARLEPEDVTAIMGHLSRLIPDEGRRAALLLDDPVGVPPALLPEPLCSHNHLHHVNDFTHFLDVTSASMAEIKTVVEWGGGYGGMAKIVRRLSPNAKKPTYVLIDSGLMTCIQWLYLATIFGESSVHQLLNRDDRIQPSKINLVPVSLLQAHGDFKADLFISTFALNESSAYAQDCVIERDWFNAKRLLLAYEPHGFSDAALRAIELSGARVEATPAAIHSSYAFR